MTVRKVAVPDTNFFLHYKQLRDVNWLQLLACDSVEIVILPRILKELDEKKFGASPKLKKRAEGALRQLRSITGPTGIGTLNESVTVRVEADEPLIDFEEHSLSKHSSDDWIIAGCIQLQERGSAHVVLLTGDYGPEFRAKQKGIDALRPPDDLRLPDEQSEEEKEIARLRKLVDRRPDLVLTFPGAERKLEQALRVIPPQRSEEVEALVAREKERFQIIKPVPLEYGALGITDRNARYAEYHAEYRRYLKELHQHKQFMGRGVELTFILDNRGNGVANDIDVVLLAEIGKDVIVLEQDADEIKPPKPPAPPTSGDFDSHWGFPHWEEVQMPDPHAPFVNVEKTEIGFRGTTRTAKLKQGQREELGTVYVFLPPEAKSFKVSYTINCEELVEDTNAELHVILSEQE